MKTPVVDSDEDDDGEPVLPDDLLEASLSLDVEEDIDDLPEDIGPSDLGPSGLGPSDIGPSTSKRPRLSE